MSFGLGIDLALTPPFVLLRYIADAKSPGQITVQTISDYFGAIGIEDMDSDVAVYIVSYELKSTSLGDLDLKAFCDGWGELKSVKTSSPKILPSSCWYSRLSH